MEAFKILKGGAIQRPMSKLGEYGPSAAASVGGYLGGQLGGKL